MSLSRNGYHVQLSEEVRKEIKKELTVRGVENALGFRPPPFKVFREGSKGSLIVPRSYGISKFGPAAKDRRADPARADIVFTGKLRAETRQLEAFEKGVQAFQEHGGGVLSLAPGFGKTVLGLAFSAQLKVRTMIIVHKEFLANQWRDRIKEFCPGATIGRVQQDEMDTDKDFVIAMIQTLCVREHAPDDFDSIGLLIVDEAHHIGAAAFSQTMFKVAAKYTLGLTATPERKDGLTDILYWFMGPEFFRIQRENQKTTEVRMMYFDAPEFREAPPVSRFGKINMAGMTTLLTEINLRNEFILKLIRDSLKEGRRVLVLSDRREHCVWINSQFEFKISGLYYGGLSEKELEESSKKPVVIGTFAMAQEGLDIPVLDTVILSTPHSDVTQAVGRIMRETAGKVNNPLIYDIVDRWSVFYSMAKKRTAFYRKAGFHIQGDEAPPPSKVHDEGKCSFI